MTLAILRHAFAMMFNDFSGTLRVTLGLYLLSQLVFVAVGVATAGVWDIQSAFTTPQGIADLPVIFWIGLIVAFVVSIILSTWMAVAWHRFVLLGETSGMLPAYPKGKVSAYFWEGFGIGMLVVVPVIVIAMILGASGLMVGETLMGGLIGIVVIYFLLRLTLGLPGVAVDNPLKVGESWKATAPLSLPIFLVGLVVMGLSLAAQFVAGALGPVGWFFTLVTGYFTTIYGLSILTTLYGSQVEKRDLQA